MASHSPIILDGLMQRNAAWVKFALQKMQGRPTKMLTTSRKSSLVEFHRFLSLTWYCSVSLLLIGTFFGTSQHLRWLVAGY
jgi:hypothetical protein